MRSDYALLIPHVAALLAYLAGLVVAIWLLVQTKSKAAILAAVSFGLLILVSLGQIGLILLVAGQLASSQGISLTLSCCCSLFDMAAIVCLIIAIWQAVSGTSVKATTQESLYDETWEEEQDEVVDVSEQAPDEATYATEKLDLPVKEQYATEVLEGEVVEETPPEPPRVTRVLSESPEEKTLEGKVLESTEAPSTKVLRDTPEEASTETSEES